MINYKLYLSCCLLIGFSLASCARDGEVEVSLNFTGVRETITQRYAQTGDDSTLPLDNIDSIVLTVSGRDFEPIVKRIPLDSEILGASVLVPEGFARRFAVAVLKEAEKKEVILKGETIADIFRKRDGAPVVVRVQLEWVADGTGDGREGEGDCTPDCEGKVCGPDGCGGVCGKCELLAYCEGDILVGGEICDGGQCVARSKEDCSAQGDSCNKGSCDERARKCVKEPLPDDTKCDDGLFCTSDDACSAGRCVGKQEDCSALSDACNNGVCSEADRGCVAKPKTDGTLCDDGLFCTERDSCQKGKCVGGVERDCSAVADACNDAGCVEDNGGACVAKPKEDGTECDDTLFCTEGDMCLDGVCTGKEIDCSAFGDQCNDGVCNEAEKTCSVTPKQNGESCDDGEFCTVGEGCFNGLCQGGSPRDCSGLTDLEFCKEGRCDEPTDACVADIVSDGTACNADGAVCRNGKCDKDECQGSQKRCSTEGSDNVVQTCGLNTDGFYKFSTTTICATLKPYCDSATTTCVECLQATNCNATTADTCSTGLCKCGTNNPCSGGTPYCVAGKCVECRSASDCSLGLKCVSGVCRECSVDSDCSSLDTDCKEGYCFNYTCARRNRSNGTFCNDGDGNECTGICTTGICTTDPKPDNTLCTGISQCHGVCSSGVCNTSAYKPNGTSCNDGEFCTINDRCSLGACIGGGTRVCDDGIACTNDYCDEAYDKCDFTVQSGYCFIDGACYTNGARNPYNDCEFCDIAYQTTWMYLGDGYSCNGGDNCLTGGSCQSGYCQGLVPLTCSGSCMTGACDPQIGCIIKSDYSPCNNQNPCTINDYCMGGECVSGNNAPDLTPCKDAYSCTYYDRCESGVCVSYSYLDMDTPCYEWGQSWCYLESICDQVGGCMTNAAKPRNCTAYTCQVGGCDGYAKVCGSPVTQGTLCSAPNAMSGNCDDKGNCIGYSCYADLFDRDCCPLNGCECDSTYEWCIINSKPRFDKIISFNPILWEKGMFVVSEEGGMIYLDDNTTSMNPGDDKVIFFDEADKLRNARNRVALVGPSGDLWIGTELGLTIFDWNGTPELKCDDEIFHYNYKSELRTTIKAIGFHSSTNLWLVGDKLYYMKHSNTLKDDLDDMIYTFDTSTIFQSGSLPTNDHSSIAVSSKDGVWLGHIANGMSFLNAGLTPENQAGISAINYTTADGMVNNNVNALTLDDEKGVLFIATSGGASILQINDPLVKGDDLWLNYTTGNSPLPSNLVNAVYIQRSSAIDKKIIWFLTEGGAAALDPGANLLSRADDVWTVFTLSDGLASNSVSSMLSLVEQIAPGAERDRRFFGTSDGLSILDDNLTLTNKADDNWLFYPDKDFAPPSPLTSLNVSQMYSYLFMGAGDKLVVHDYYSDVFCKQNDAHCEIPIGIPGSVTGVGTPMNGDIVWIGTENGLFYWNYNATICNPGDDGWQTFTTTDGLSSNNIADVLTPMGNQYVFVATDQGLDLLDNKATFIGKADDTYTYYTHVSLTNLSQLLNIDTSNIAIASKTDGFAILTHSGTLTNIGDDTISVYTTVDLLPSDTINAIELIGMDVFVLATDSGLVVRDTKGTPHNKGDDVWQVYTAADGLPGNNILDVFVVDNQHAWLICDGSESIVWLDLGIMPTDKGDDNLTVINPMNSGLMRGTKRFIEPDFFSGQSLWYSLDAPGFGHMKFTLSGI